MTSTIPRVLRLSDAAYFGLLQKFVPYSDSDPMPYSTDSGIAYHRDTSKLPVEGISHALNIYALLPLTDWEDTRPASIRGNHAALIQYTDATRLPWFYQPQPLSEEDLEDPSNAPTPEELLSLSRRKHKFRLTDASRRFYVALALLHKMETHSGRHSEGDYVATCLEAIGIGWLSPPSRYCLDGQYLVPPNPNKIHASWRSTHTIKRAVDMSREEIRSYGKPGPTK